MADDPLDRLAGRQRQMEGTPDPPTAERLGGLLEPLEDAERDDIIGGALARLAGEAEIAAEDDSGAWAEAEQAGPDEPEAQGDPPDAGDTGDVVPIGRGRPAWVRPVFAAAVAIAAALVLWLVIRPGDDGGLQPPLPSYSATRLHGGAMTMRSSDDGLAEPLSLTADDRIDWLFTPEAPVRVPVAAAILAVGPDSEVFRRVDGAEVSSEGVVRIRGALSETVPLSAGAWRITVLIGNPDAMPTSAAQAADSGPWVPVTFEATVRSP